jgi:hypothetical protein
MLPRPLRLLFDLLEPVFSAAKLSSNSIFAEAGRRFSVQTELEYSGLLASGRYRKITAVSCFEPFEGLRFLKVVSGGEKLFELEQI